MDLPTVDTLAPSVAQRVIEVGKRFEAACLAGQKPNIQEYLGETKEPERSVLFRHLVTVEWSCLRTQENAPSLNEYLTRFPEHQELLRSLSEEIQEQSKTASTIGGVLSSSSSSSSATRPGATVATSTPWPTIPGYEILEEIGHGGMGIVYKARQVKLRRLVALKVMMPELASNPTARKRFKREAEAMAAIEHEHVVSIFQVGEEGGLPFLAMQFLEGETLQDRLKREQKLPCSEVIRLGRQMAEGLSAAHHAGLVHRDIKPGNIWLESSGEWRGASGEQKTRGERDDAIREKVQEPRVFPNVSLATRHSPLATHVKILDFGLARAADQNTLLSEPGALMGTPQYMSPEQAQGEELDARSDLFSLGAVLYRMAGGDLPFQATTVVALLMAIVQDPARPLHVLNPDVPRELSDLIMQCLHKEPAKRPKSAQEIAAALERMEQGLPPVPAGERKKPRRRLLLTLGGALVAAVVLALLLFAQNSNGEVRIDSDDPNLEIVFDQTGPALKAADKEPISLPAGEHAILLKGSDFKVELDPLILQKGQTVTFKFVLADRRVQLLDGENVIATRDIPLASKFTNKLGMEFTLVPRGVSWLGGGSGKIGDRKLTVPHDFYLGTYEVTQGEWLTLMEGNPSNFSRTGNGKAVLDISDADLQRFPVENVTWHDCQDFIARLNKKWREAGWVYRLPTDVEWEYACRGGPVPEKNDLGFDFYFDQPTNELTPDKCNFSRAGLKRTCMVGSYLPNRLGLYDMHGNVREWCEDAMDGKNPAFRVGRGGQWSTDPEFCKASARFEHDPNNRSDGMGLRLARVAIGKGPVPPPVEEKDSGLPREFERHPGGVRCVTFSKDGKLAISGGNDRLIRVSELAGGKRPTYLKGHGGVVLSLAVHPDGRHLVSGGDDRTIRVWELASGRFLRQFQGVTHPCWGLSISPDGTLVAGGSEEKGFRLWDFASGKLIGGFQDAWVNALAFSPSGEQILGGGQDGKPRLWDMKQGKLVRTFPGHRAWIRAVCFSGDGSLAVTCSGNSPRELQPGDDFSVRLWDVAKGQEIFSFKGHEHRVFGAALSRDGRWILSGSYDKTLRLWDVEKRTEKHRCIANALVNSVALSPDASLALSGDEDGKVQLWRLPTELPPALTGLKPGKLLLDVDFLVPEKNPFQVSRPGDKSAHRMELVRGRYIMHFPASENYWIGWSPTGQYRNFILQATGMASEKNGIWGIYVNGTPNSLSFRIMLRNSGQVELSRAPWGKAFTVPKLTPLLAESYRPGEFNTLTLARRERELTIFVNGRQVAKSIMLEQDLGSCSCGIMAEQFAAKNMRAEFKRYSVWELADLGKADAP